MSIRILVPSCRNSREAILRCRLLTRAAQQRLPSHDRQGVVYADLRNLALGPPWRLNAIRDQFLGIQRRAIDVAQSDCHCFGTRVDEHVSEELHARAGR